MKRLVLLSALSTILFSLNLPSASATPVYAFTAHTFNACGKNGPTGPTTANCRNNYNTTWDENSSNFSVTGGIQYWTVPFTGRFYIDAYGAGGAGLNGGGGARIADTFDLVQGEVIRILVGQAPTTYYNFIANAGGGGTFVTRSPHNTNESILIVAGGGAGTETATVMQSVAPASLTTSGNNGSGTVSATGSGEGGLNGNGGGVATLQNSGGAGGGFFTDGARNTIFGNNGGSAYVNGGAGAAPGTSGNAVGGGFGGGGAANGNGNGGGAGGGGGYSGGGGGDNVFGNSGGGGGSYFANGLNLNRITTANARAFHNNGSVVITALTFPTVSLSVSGGKTSAPKGQVTVITANVNQEAHVTFYADQKRIPSCVGLRVNNGNVNCNWRPTIQKAVLIRAAVVSGARDFISSSALNVAVVRRTGTR